jgi:hypothetical protein
MVDFAYITLNSSDPWASYDGLRASPRTADRRANFVMGIKVPVGVQCRGEGAREGGQCVGVGPRSFLPLSSSGRVPSPTTYRGKGLRSCLVSQAVLIM